MAVSSDNHALLHEALRGHSAFDSHQLHTEVDGTYAISITLKPGMYLSAADLVRYLNEQGISLSMPSKIHFSTSQSPLI